MTTAVGASDDDDACRLDPGEALKYAKTTLRRVAQDHRAFFHDDYLIGLDTALTKLEGHEQPTASGYERDLFEHSATTRQAEGMAIKIGNEKTADDQAVLRIQNIYTLLVDNLLWLTLRSIGVTGHSDPRLSVIRNSGRLRVHKFPPDERTHGR